MAQAVKRKVFLYGELAEKFGPVFEIRAETVARAIKVLEANFPGRFINSIQKDAGYYVIEGDLDDLDRCTGVHSEDLLTWQNTADLHIMPQAVGSKAIVKIFLVVVGVALMIAGVLTGNSMLFMAGMGLTMTGIGLLMMPSLEMDDNKADEKKTMLFKGATNTSEQGSMVPIIYGEHLTGSIVASAHIRSNYVGRDFTHDIGWKPFYDGDTDGVDYSNVILNSEPVYFVQADTPSTHPTGAVWFDTDAAYQPKTWNGSAWVNYSGATYESSGRYWNYGSRKAYIREYQSLLTGGIINMLTNVYDEGDTAIYPDGRVYVWSATNHDWIIHQDYVA